MYVFPGNKSITCKRPPQGTRTRIAMCGWVGRALYKEGKVPINELSGHWNPSYALSHVYCHKVISPRVRGLSIWFLHRNNWASGPIWILKNVKKPSVEIFFPFSLFLPSFPVPQEPDPFYYGEWQILWWGYPGAWWRGGCRSSRVTAEVASVVADMCWGTSHVITWINQLGSWRAEWDWGYLLWAPFRLHQDSGLVHWSHQSSKQLWGQVNLNPVLFTH